MELCINIDGVPRRTKVTEQNRSWGNGARFEINGSEGDTLYNFGVNTHPEFDEFEKYQAMSLEEISLEIKQRLETGLYLDSLKEAKSEGVDMLFRLNPTPLQSHNKALKFSVKNTQN
jgi:hypothetical protein